jgi:hypothetical protein
MSIMERMRPRAGGAGRTPAEPTHLDEFLKTNPASTGVLAGVVTMSGQIAAQLQVPGLGCRIVALVFAALLGYYQVAIAQRRPARESAFLVPIVAVILFTTGWGANGLLYEATARASGQAAQITIPARPHASLGEWLAERFVPAAHAQSGNGKGGDRKDDQGGWKKW